MDNSNGYNGWTNRETWCLHLWLTGDYGLYQAAKLLKANASNPKQLMRLLKVFTESQSGSNVVAKMLSDIGNMDKVNYLEVATALYQNL